MPILADSDSRDGMVAKDNDSLPLRLLLSPGQSIIIEGISTNGEKYERWSQYKSRIQKVEDDSIVVSSPRRRGAVVRFSDGSDVTIYVNRFGVRLRFQALVSNPPDTPLVTRLVDIADLQKYDRRQHVRVPLLLQPTSFRIVGDEKQGLQTLAPLILDISLGGIGISCLQDIAEGSTIQIAFELPRIIGQVRASAEVCRAFDPIHDNTGKTRWHMGLKFVDISDADLARIATFVTYQQEKMKKKGVFSKLSGRHNNRA
ncbi:MAG: flagellar brake protein [Chloroflexota bacterium]